MKKMNNKGFSLVELIIVIAIMAVLVGILAPQYLKYVNNSKVSTDIANAEQIATTINVAVSDGDTANLTISAGTATATGGTNLYSDGTRTVVTPKCALKDGENWTIKWDDVNGVTEITLYGEKIWPDAGTFTPGGGSVGDGYLRYKK